jgi:hypothetical protein
MKNNLLPFLLICIASINSCSKIECTVKNPFDNKDLANYKCAKDCKTEEELKQGFNCIRCTTSTFDTIATCDKALADSLYLYYQANPTTGNCTKVDPIVLCNN